jgi:hypothetical protein
MIPPLAQIIRCPGTIDHHRLAEIMEKAIASRLPHVPLLRAALVDDDPRLRRRHNVSSREALC